MQYKSELKRLHKRIKALEKRIDEHPKLQAQLDRLCEQAEGILRVIDQKNRAQAA